MSIIKLSDETLKPHAQQTTNLIALVKPTYLTRCIRVQESQEDDNYFQNPEIICSKDEIDREFNGLIRALKTHHVTIVVYESPKYTYDSIFPNNWISVHWETMNPMVVIYAMKYPNRRLERQSQLLIDIILHKYSQSLSKFLT
jgi:hypothetical protein